MNVARKPESAWGFTEPGVQTFSLLGVNLAP